jgi:hypothetical protein
MSPAGSRRPESASGKSARESSLTASRPHGSTGKTEGGDGGRPYRPPRAR